VGKSDIVAPCAYVSAKKDGSEAPGTSPASMSHSFNAKGVDFRSWLQRSGKGGRKLQLHHQNSVSMAILLVGQGLHQLCWILKQGHGI